ncbi:glyoxalase/bleomycin resistance protein/dioxygenase [Plectosphaerella plurivora]|uniref:Glyoxalase/bleomycin resistance protein/dioxygenase n=1 Tax=Plectosphaerella plurivora TaxID=936078 RepID=A0A9P8VDL5_9PEZI|nr:glyoxalase/bleomycin resistance protein/dioxygenase [Plectosphaerella plurivora]
MTIDHVGILVPRAQHKEVLNFYLAVLTTLGYKLLTEPVPGVAGMGTEQPDWWINATDEPNVGIVHVAFGANERDDVRKFHEAAIAAGAKDNGAPGVRVHYHPAYYSAFVKDPAGNNLEVVCHSPGSK